MHSTKTIAIIIATIVLLAFLLLMLLLAPSRAEMPCSECEQLINSIFEADEAGHLNPSLTQEQILELNNACDSQLITEDDIKEIAPQYWNRESYDGLNSNLEDEDK